jgi:hypothetical protein
MSLLTDPPIDFLAIEDCVWCGLKEQTPIERKLQAFYKSSFGATIVKQPLKRVLRLKMSYRLHKV